MSSDEDDGYLMQSITAATAAKAEMAGLTTEKLTFERTAYPELYYAATPEMVEHNAWNRAGQPLIRAAGVPILDVWRSTSLAWNAHVGFGDCTHWCVPGVMDHWTDPLHSLVQERLMAFL